MSDSPRTLPKLGLLAALLAAGAALGYRALTRSPTVEGLQAIRSQAEPIAPAPGDDRLYGLIEPIGRPDGPGGNPDLAAHERTVYSQHGEDGVLERIFELIPPGPRYAVEFGGGDGVTLSNVRNLILEHGFGALMIDGDPDLVDLCTAVCEDLPAAKCRHAWVYPGNVELLFEEEGVPYDLDLLVIDIDSNDWYVWRAIHDFEPEVVQIEYSGPIAPPQRMVVDFHPMNYHDDTAYFEASIQSLYDLGRRRATSWSTRASSA